MRRVLVPILLLCTLGGCMEMPPPAQIGVADALGGDDLEGFERATRVREFRFPEDHGPHDSFRNEWWYLTGNLEDENGNRYGFQVTFFRIALRPSVAASPSAWRSNQVWMAHAALSDIGRTAHLAEERFARAGIGLAGAQAKPLRVWLEDWRLDEGPDEDTWHLQLEAQNFALDIRLDSSGPIILQGNRGLSQKSAEPGNASYYYSIPRLPASGEITVNGIRTAVSGLAWFDREWSTSALGPEQEGWDWFSLQLHDGRNLMYYQLRKKGGGVDPHSSGSVSDNNGFIRALGADSIALEPVRFWHSEGIDYPIEWRFQLLSEPTPWRIKALLEAQKMDLSVRYWEGAVEVIDEHTGIRLGLGYLEMAGYE